MSTISVPESMPRPLDGFTINYRMFGSKFGVGAASAQVSFYISASPDGSTGVALLTSFQMTLNGSGLGPYFPPSGTQSTFISRFSMPSSTVDLLEAITDACEPQTWYILGDVDFTPFAHDESLLGTVKPPDFFFTGGTLDPSVIAPGGTTFLSFALFNQCPASSSSRVGIFLADEDLQPLAFIGAVSVGPGAGTSTLPPTPIDFSPFIPTGVYHIVLIADVDEVIPESDEDNNAGYFVLDIVSNAQANALDEDVGELEIEVMPPFDAASAARDPELDSSAGYIEGF